MYTEIANIVNKIQNTSLNKQSFNTSKKCVTQPISGKK